MSKLFELYNSAKPINNIVTFFVQIELGGEEFRVPRYILSPIIKRMIKKFASNEQELTPAMVKDFGDPDLFLTLAREYPMFKPNRALIDTFTYFVLYSKLHGVKDIPMFLTDTFQTLAINNMVFTPFKVEALSDSEIIRARDMSRYVNTVYIVFMKLFCKSIVQVTAGTRMVELFMKTDSSYASRLCDDVMRIVKHQTDESFDSTTLRFTYAEQGFSHHYVLCHTFPGIVPIVVVLSALPPQFINENFERLHLHEVFRECVKRGSLNIDIGELFIQTEGSTRMNKLTSLFNLLFDVYPKNNIQTESLSILAETYKYEDATA